jgi:hypothetical protein
MSDPERKSITVITNVGIRGTLRIALLLRDVTLNETFGGGWETHRPITWYVILMEKPHGMEQLSSQGEIAF